MQSAYAFILMGPVHDDEKNLNMFDPIMGVDQNGSYTTVSSANMTDDLGGPKAIKEFYRWNTPHLVYGFDREFVRFFGEDGILAVNEAMGVLNDFFEPRDGQYSGVSELDLMRHGYQGNFSTYWLNVTARNENLMDIKSLVLGMMVNYLGLGNPYRQMFTATNAWYADPLNPGQVVLGVTLKNFDPITLKPTDFVNGDQYAYRLIHDQVPGFLPNPVTQPPGGNVSSVTLDMEEFTNSDTVNTYSAVSAIVDAFYGNTEMVWTRVPSRYGFGIYYDGLNAMGGSYRPRHALTYDDAGGLKYMYNTNTVVMEYSPYALVKSADFTKTLERYNLAPYDDPLLNRIGGVFPRRNAQMPFTVAQSHPLYTFLNPIGPGPDMVFNTADDVNLLTKFMAQRDPANQAPILGFVTAGGRTPGKMAWAFRGGIDSIQFHEASYDSLLNMSHYPTNYTWIDTFMTNANIRNPIVSTVTNTTPGAAIALTDSLSNYYQQTLGRTAQTPDFIFSASQVLGFPMNQVQTAWIREVPFDDLTAPQPDDGQLNGGAWKGNPTRRTSAWEYNSFLYYTETAGASGPGIWSSQPGQWDAAASPPIYAGYHGLHMVFNSSINIGGFEVVWSGESSVVGNQLLPIQYQQWAWIRGPGVNDFTKFPRDYDVANRLIENTILPITAVPVISMVSDNGGLSSIAPTSLSRTEEQITMIGTGFLSATAIEVLDPSGAVVQVFSPADSFVKHDKLIEIPADTFSYLSEGYSRQIRVWNPVGPSELSKEKFNINTGRPQIYSTSADNLIYNRSTPLTIHGSGFKSKVIHSNDNNNTITHLRVDDLTSGTIWPVGGIPVYGTDVSASLEVISDKKAILYGGILPSHIDTNVGIRIRVSRGSISSISPPTESYIFGVTGAPAVSLVRYMDDITNVFIEVNGTNPLRRDAALIIDGTALNSVTSIEIIQLNGFSWAPPVYADLVNRANILDTGTRITLQAHAFSESSADGHTVPNAKLRIVNSFGTVTYSKPFNVNIQPSTVIDLSGTEGPNPESRISTAHANTVVGAPGMVWNRDAAATGDGRDIEFLAAGTGGLKAVTRIRVINESSLAAPANHEPAYIDLPAHGVTVSDTRIKIFAKEAKWEVDPGSTVLGIAAADSAHVADWRRFKLIVGGANGVGDRDDCFTGASPAHVIIGKPPVIDSYEFNGSFVERDYERDNHTITIRGTDLQLVELVEVVDKDGGMIPDVPGAAGLPVQRTTNLSVPSPNIYSVDAGGIELNSTVWAPPNYPHMGIADTIAGPSAPATGLGKMDGRRLKVMNVFSMDLGNRIMSSAEDTFTQSARPDFEEDLTWHFNLEVYHSAEFGVLEEHWIDINGSGPDPTLGGGTLQPVVLTVNPGPGGIPPAAPTLSGSLMGVRTVYFESNRGPGGEGPDGVPGTDDDVWTVQRFPEPNYNYKLPTAGALDPGITFVHDTARFDFNESGQSATTGIQISPDGRTMTLDPLFIRAFNRASVDFRILPMTDRAASFPPVRSDLLTIAGFDGVDDTQDDLGYWNENLNDTDGRRVSHRIRFETVAGVMATTADAASPLNPLPPPAPQRVDNGLFYTFITAMESGLGAFIRDVDGSGMVSPTDWERNGTLQVTGPGLVSARWFRFVDARDRLPLSARSSVLPNIDDFHTWISIPNLPPGAPGSWIGIPGAVPGAPNETRITIPADQVDIRDDGHIVDSASDTQFERRRVELMFLNGNRVLSTLHEFTISRPIVWQDFGGLAGADADDVFQDHAVAPAANRESDGLYFSKYNSFGWRLGEFLSVRGVPQHNNMRGVARIDLVNIVGGVPVTVGTPILFDTTGAAPTPVNVFHSFVAAGDDPVTGAAPNGGADVFGFRSAFLYLPDTLFSDPVRNTWFESGGQLQDRALLFTMRSGTTTLSPTIRAGRAPTFVALNTDGVGLPLREQGGGQRTQEKTIPLHNVLGNFAFNRDQVPGFGSITHLDFSATDVNRTHFQAIWFELSDDTWPFGEGDGSVNPGRPTPELDDFVQGFATRTYPGSPSITRVQMENEVNPATGLLDPWRSALSMPNNSLDHNIDVIRFDRTLFDRPTDLFGNVIGPSLFRGVDTPGDTEDPIWVDPFFVDQGPPAGQAGIGTSAMRLSRQVVVETLYGQASSFAEIANPADAKVVTMSSLWDFTGDGILALDGTPGHEWFELNEAFETDTIDATIPAGIVAPPTTSGWVSGTAVVPIVATTRTAHLREGHNLVITTPIDPNFFGRQPIAGGVRGLEFRADNNQSRVTIMHDDWNRVPFQIPALPNQGRINRAFYVSGPNPDGTEGLALRQIVLNGNYIAEEMRRELEAPNTSTFQHTFSTVFNTPLTSVAQPTPPWPPVGAGPNGGGVWLQIISAGGQNFIPAATDFTGQEPNVIGPFATSPAVKP